MENSEMEKQSNRNIGCVTLVIICMVLGYCMDTTESKFTKVEITDDKAKLYYTITEYDMDDSNLPADYLVRDILGYIYDFAMDNKNLKSIELIYLNKCIDVYGKNAHLRTAGRKVFDQDALNEMYKYKNQDIYKNNKWEISFTKLTYKNNCRGEPFEE